MRCYNPVRLPDSFATVRGGYDRFSRRRCTFVEPSCGACIMGARLIETKDEVTSRRQPQFPHSRAPPLYPPRRTPCGLGHRRRIVAWEVREAVGA